MQKKDNNYKFYSHGLLTRSKAVEKRLEEIENHENYKSLKNFFNLFELPLKIVKVHRGINITIFEIKSPGDFNLKEFIDKYENDICVALSSPEIRFVELTSTDSSFGIESINRLNNTITLGDIYSDRDSKRHYSGYKVPIGIDIYGNINSINILELPHLLIGGEPFSGKSTLLSSLIITLLLMTGPNNLRFIISDIKSGILSLFNGIPNLLTPIISDPQKVLTALSWMKEEIDRRFRLLVEYNCTTFDEYNDLLNNRSLDYKGLEPIKPLLMIIDELYGIIDLDIEFVEEAITWIVQTGRAVGIHMIITSSYDSENVFTGLIKANIPSRIVMKTISSIQSKHFLDFSGAEKLSGCGDMLFLPCNLNKPVRLKSFFVESQDIKNVVKFMKKG